MKPLVLAALTVFLLPSISNSQNLQGFRPDGINGWVGAGFASFTMESPNNTNMYIDDGVFATLGGEKGFGFLSSYLTINFSFLDADGQTLYNYTEVLTTDNWSTLPGQSTTFTANIFQLNMGWKVKLFGRSWFSPYIEAGGNFGYFQIKYKNLSTSLTGCQTGPCLDNVGFKESDSLIEFGYYGEFGLEAQFSDTFGVRVGARFIDDETRPFETLGNNEVNYQTVIYYLTAMKAF